MIKKLLTLISLLWICQQGYAQNADAFWKRFQKLYNEDKFTEIYNLLSPAFQEEMSLEQHIALFKNGISQSAGKMNGAVLIKAEEDAGTYLLTFAQMKLEVLLLLDKEDKVQGWLWKPYKEQKAQAINVQYVNPLKNKTDSTIDREARKYLEQNPKAQLSFAIVQPGKTDHYYYTAGLLPDAQSVYELGSITKTYIGWLVAQAVIEGKLDPDADIRKYLKGTYKNLEREGQAILVRHLLNHSSGLPRLPENLLQLATDQDNPYKAYGEEQLLNSLKTITLSRKPGTQSVYSNYGYSVLGYILEQVYQQPLEQLLNLKLQAVLKLDSISFKPGPVLIQGHDGDQAPVPAWEFQVMAGAGAIKTTLKATASFLEQQIISEDPAIRLSQLVIDAKIEPQTAYAWQINPLKNQADTLIWHNGMTGGFSSFYGFFKQKKIGLVLLSSVAQPVDAYAGEILKVIRQQ
ncbi:MAG: serine hydrolase [Taibaiella sp.]|nr:serine hydrolase [Taibaiella sp.]